MDPTYIKPFPKKYPAFKWLNYFDKHDALDWPLIDLSEEYKKMVDADIQINAGSIIGWTPLSHKFYWRSRAFLTPLVADIREILDAKKRPPRQV